MHAHQAAQNNQLESPLLQSIHSKDLEKLESQAERQQVLIKDQEVLVEEKKRQVLKLCQRREILDKRILESLERSSDSSNDSSSTTFSFPNRLKEIRQNSQGLIHRYKELDSKYQKELSEILE